MSSVRFLALVILLICSRSGYCQKLPTTWQPGMKIAAGYGGGMTEYSYEISITAGESYMITKGENAGIVKKKFSSKQLDALLTFLRDHNFDKIRAEHTGPADDKASESITLSWGDNVVVLPKDLIWISPTISKTTSTPSRPIWKACLERNKLSRRVSHENTKLCGLLIFEN